MRVGLNESKPGEAYMPGSIKSLFIHIPAVLAMIAAAESQAFTTRASVSGKPTADAGAPHAEADHMPVLTESSFGFQCGTGRSSNCPHVTWPTTIAQPGIIRLWDSQVQWNALHASAGAYRWNTLDAYLDAIAAHQPRDAMYTFGYTPCWDTKGECRPQWGSANPPNDLNPNGSSSFNAFVTALVNHCSPAGHCVKDYIKYWEMWNEANAENYWNGTIAQLYSLMAPAVAIIRKNVSGPLILTPPANRGDTIWMQNWLNEENSHGRLSDIFSFHLYLQNQTPETRFDIIQQMVNLKNSTTGWTDTPWMNTETNFDAATFACSSRYTSDDCVGQIVRWHLLHYASGGAHLSWFFFNTTIGGDPNYSNAYHYMMQWLVGGHFTAECSTSGSVYTCPFIQANGHHALFVWNPSDKGTYSPATQYVDYRELNGTTTRISPGPSVTIGVKPIMFEASN